MTFALHILQKNRCLEAAKCTTVSRRHGRILCHHPCTLWGSYFGYLAAPRMKQERWTIPIGFMGRTVYAPNTNTSSAACNTTCVCSSHGGARTSASPPPSLLAARGMVVGRGGNAARFGSSAWLPGRHHTYYRQQQWGRPRWASPCIPACLDPILPEGPRHRIRVHWPGCEHPYHLACLARVRARRIPPRAPCVAAPGRRTRTPPFRTPATALASCHWKIENILWKILQKLPPKNQQNFRISTPNCR